MGAQVCDGPVEVLSNEAGGGSVGFGDLAGMREYWLLVPGTPVPINFNCELGDAPDGSDPPPRPPTRAAVQAYLEGIEAREGAGATEFRALEYKSKSWIAGAGSSFEVQDAARNHVGYWTFRPEAIGIYREAAMVIGEGMHYPFNFALFLRRITIDPFAGINSTGDLRREMAGLLGGEGSFGVYKVTDIT